MRNCPNCKKPINSPLETEAGKPKFFPFCSQRCKLIDLGAWFDAKYTVPCEGNDQNPQNR
ncbi:DNA gyrase inhibitor YacG [Planctomycetota bacterium]